MTQPKRHQQTGSAFPASVLHSIYRKLPKPPSTNYSLRRFTTNLYKLLPKNAVVLDVGAKSAAGGYWDGAGEVSLVSLDIQAFPGVNLVGDVQRLPLQSESVHAVACISVLMYIPNPFLAVEEMYRVLKPGGYVYINAPLVYRSAPDPIDLYRFSYQGLGHLCSRFEALESGFNRGPCSTMADMLTYFFALLFCFNSKAGYSLLLDFFQWCFFWLKYLDKLVANYDSAEVIHSADFFFGRKPL